jgi:catechol 2,3-dioxygenase-like lactoylglutathione lyase family enzyme
MPAKEFRPVDRHLDGIDHLIIGVRDLEAARARYARLGFNTTPRGAATRAGARRTTASCSRTTTWSCWASSTPAGFTNNLDRLPGGARRGLLGMALPRATPPARTRLGRRWPGRPRHPAPWAAC